jgi:predicted flap endonuclease-1-like 5' DNA nuclease
MTASVPIGLDGLRDRVEDYRDRLSSLGQAMSELQQYADALLAAIEQDCRELQNARSELAATPDAVTDDMASAPQPDIHITPDTATAADCITAPAEVDDPETPVTDATQTSIPAAIPVCPDDFTLIKGIDPATADTLANLGLTTFADLANLYQEDVEEIAIVLADRRRIGRECWIEQAAILASGHTTDYVRQMSTPVRADATQAPVTSSDLPQPTCKWAPCFAPLLPDALPATGPQFTSDPSCANSNIETQIAEARAAAARTRRMSHLTGARQRAKQQTLSRHRSSPRPGWKLALTAAAAVTLAVISGSLVAGNALQNEIVTRITRLGTCTVDSISSSHDCAVLAWLLL